MIDNKTVPIPQTITSDNTAGHAPVTDFNKIVKKEMKRLKREHPELHKALKQAEKIRKQGVCPHCGRCACEPTYPTQPTIVWQA